MQSLHTLSVYLLAAASWMQFGGPQANFTTESTALGSPKKLWTRDLGEGYSSISSDGATLFTMYREGTKEFTVALDAGTGKTLWQSSQDAPFSSGMDMQFGSGPHATPLVTSDKVFSVGILANLRAFDKKTGNVIWSHDLIQEFHSEVPGRGYAPSPIAYKDWVIVKIGGPNALIAFRQSDGKVVWKNQQFENSPSTPILANISGQEQLIYATADSLAGADPNTGELLWKHSHPCSYGLNIALPVVGPDNIVFISSAYTGGSRAVQLTRSGSKTTVKELWNGRRMRVHHGTIIRIGDTVYGSSGDFGPAPMTAVDVKTGNTLWQDRTFPKANFVYADGKLVLVDEDGTLALVTVNEKGMAVLNKTSLLDKNAWTPPTLVGTKLYLRDRKSIVAVDLAR